MRNAKYLLLFISFIFIACQGSDAYQGKWKAMDGNHKKFEITFEPKEIVIKDSLGETKKYAYKQNSVKYVNGVSTYGISVDDGRIYQINFPKKDETVGLIKDENGMVMYTINRTKYLTYDEVYKLN